MMTAEELDALNALLRERDDAIEALRASEVEYWAATTAYGKERGAQKRADASVVVAQARSNVANATEVAAPRLLAEARQAAILRAKLIESETWRTELRAEMDAVKGKLREVTGLLSDMVDRAGPSCSARDMLGDPHCDDEDCGNCDFDDRVIAALEAAR